MVQQKLTARKSYIRSLLRIFDFPKLKLKAVASPAASRVSSYSVDVLPPGASRHGPGKLCILAPHFPPGTVPLPLFYLFYNCIHLSFEQLQWQGDRSLRRENQRSLFTTDGVMSRSAAEEVLRGHFFKGEGC